MRARGPRKLDRDTHADVARAECGAITLAHQLGDGRFVPFLRGRGLLLIQDADAQIRAVGRAEHERPAFLRRSFEQRARPPPDPAAAFAAGLGVATRCSK
jgi:hypothetical protein